MACTSWNCGSACAFGSGGCSCGSDCGGKCSSCASSNSFGWGSCTCGDNCSGGCSGSCSGSCTGSCTGGCNTTCTAACANNCDTTCSETCTGGCGSSCNIGCTDTSAVDLYNTLVAGLDKKILAADMNNINQMLVLEAARRSATITPVTFTQGVAMSSNDVKQLQSNVSVIDASLVANESADAKIKSMRATGQELINLTLTAYEQTLT